MKLFHGLALLCFCLFMSVNSAQAQSKTCSKVCSKKCTKTAKVMNSSTDVSTTAMAVSDAATPKKCNPAQCIKNGGDMSQCKKAKGAKASLVKQVAAPEAGHKKCKAKTTKVKAKVEASALAEAEM